MTLKSITIQNYQSHKNSEIQLHPGVNAIIGASDSGKSAVLRSLNWVLTNRPGGEAFRSTWGGRTLVELEFTDGAIAGREKDKENVYYTADQEYKAFKSDVPDDIQQALNLSDINLQAQMDSPFLLSATSGEVAKLLNRVANLTQIDTAISNIKSKVQANSREIKTTEAQIEELEKQQASFQYIEQMEKDVIEYEKFIKQNEVFGNNYSILDTIIVRLEENQKELDELETFLQADQPLQAVLALAEEEKTAVGQIRQLQAIIATVEERQKEEREIKTFLEAESELETALGFVEQLNDIQKEGQVLQNMVNGVEKTKRSLGDISVIIEEKEEIFHKLFPDGPCPLCGRVYE